MTLTQDIYSKFDTKAKERKLYGRRGEKVTVVFTSLPALVVENQKGERFTVNAGNVE